MMKSIFLRLSALGISVFLGACQNDSATSSPAKERPIAARIVRSASMDKNVWNQTDTVQMIVRTSDDALLLNRKLEFSTGKLDFGNVSAPNDKGVRITANGYNFGILIWTASSTLEPSNDPQTAVLTIDSAKSITPSPDGTVSDLVFQTSKNAWSSNDVMSVYDQPIRVYLSCPTPGTSIHYTLDGRTPDKNSPISGDSGILITANSTLRAIGQKYGWTPSNAFQRQIAFQTQLVSFGANGNAGWPPYKIGLSCPTPKAVIHYTMDGSAPTINSPIYSDSLTFNNGDIKVNIQAFAVDPITNYEQAPVTNQLFGLNVTWNTSITYDTLFDSRDNHTYRTVVINGQKWMAENLNYYSPSMTDSSWCYDNDTVNCVRYGRLYSWTAAMGIDYKYTNEPWNGNDSLHQGICPNGWHVPTENDWFRSFPEASSSSNIIGRSLRSVGGWLITYQEPSQNDPYGFRFMPAGQHYSLIDTTDNDTRKPFNGLFIYGDIWSTGPLFGVRYNLYGIGYGYGYYIRSTGASLRCVKN